MSTVVQRAFRARIPIAILAAAMLLTPLVGQPAEGISPGAEVVYVADGRSFADALVGSALAAANNTSMLTVEGTRSGDSVPQATREELARLKPKSIVILGGLVAVSQKVEDDLATYTDPPGNTSRLQGDDRYATAVEISKAIPDAVKRAVDADTVDGKHAADFLGAADKAADSEKLDGLDSTAFVTRQQGPLMWFESGFNSFEEADGMTPETLASVTLELPEEPACADQDTRHELLVQLSGNAAATFESQEERERVWFRFAHSNGFFTPIKLTLVPSSGGRAETSGASQFARSAMAGSTTFTLSALVVENSDFTEVSGEMTVWHRGFECV